MLPEQANIKKDIIAENGQILPFSVKKSRCFLVFVFIGVFALYAGSTGIVHNHFPDFLSDIGVSYVLKPRNDFSYILFFLTGLIFLFAGYKYINSPGKFIIKEDCIETYAFRGLGFSISESKNVFLLSKEVDEIRIRKLGKKFALFFYIHSLKSKNIDYLFSNPFNKLNEALVLGQQLASQINVKKVIFVDDGIFNQYNIMVSNGILPRDFISGVEVKVLKVN